MAALINYLQSLYSYCINISIRFIKMFSFQIFEQLNEKIIMTKDLNDSQKAIIGEKIGVSFN